MKNPLSVLAACAAVVLLAAGCSKTETPAPLPQSATKKAPDSSAPNSADTVAPKLPDPVVPKGAEAASPKPGQAGDQSSPAFKGGGAPDPHK